MDDATIFETHRPALLALAYRMLGEVAGAEDIVQDAWVRWHERKSSVDRPRAFLLTTVAHLCLDQIGSARHRREQPRSDRLPEPVELERTALARLETLDRISMAFLVVLQRLTPAERAVFLLHDVFDMGHREIGARLGKSDAACRQLLERARDNVATERRVFDTEPDEHRRMLATLVGAMASGDEAAIERLLADDAVLVVDPGPATHYGRMRVLGGPIVGGPRVLAIMRSFLEQPPTVQMRFEPRTLNGEAGVVTVVAGRVTSALTIAVGEGRIRHLFVQYDPERLRRVGAQA